jgi:hypothetical protein
MLKMSKPKANWEKCTTATSDWLYYQGDFYSSEEEFILDWLSEWTPPRYARYMNFIGKLGDCRYSVDMGPLDTIDCTLDVHLDKGFPPYLYGTKPYYLSISNLEAIVEKMVDQYVDAVDFPYVPIIYAEDLFEDFVDRVYEDTENDFNYGEVWNNAVGLSELELALDNFCSVNAATIRRLASDEKCYSHIYTLALESVEGKEGLQYALDTCALLNSNNTWISVVDNRVMAPISEDTWLKYIIDHLKE